MQQYFGKAMVTEHYMHTSGRKQNKTKTPPNNQPQWLSVSFFPVVSPARMVLAFLITAHTVLCMYTPTVHTGD